MGKHYQTEKEFLQVVENYAAYMRHQVLRYDLQKYGLDPEDILQEVRIRLWRVIRSEKTIVSPASYIRRTVSSAVIDQLRKRHRDEDLIYHEKHKQISERAFPFLGEGYQQKLLEETVGKAVERLLDSRRQVVKLYLLNFNIREIACFLNWSHDKTRNLLYRGLEDIRKSMKNMEIDHED
jgi:RNA polymerase sigma factor (sigma-70 family)